MDFIQCVLPSAKPNTSSDLNGYYPVIIAQWTDIPQPKSAKCRPEDNDLLMNDEAEEQTESHKLGKASSQRRFGSRMFQIQTILP